MRKKPEYFPPPFELPPMSLFQQIEQLVRNEFGDQVVLESIKCVLSSPDGRITFESK